MRLKTWRLWLVVSLAILMGAVGWSWSGLYGPTASAGGNGGANGPVGPDPIISPGAGWSATVDTPPAFFWEGSGQPYNNEGAFTFNTPIPVVVRVTDDFLKGDQFRVYDNGVAIGDTSFVPEVYGSEVGPDAAFVDPTYSHGSFLLDPGDHALTIQVITNPYGSGRGYIRVDMAYHEICPTQYQFDSYSWENGMNTFIGKQQVYFTNSIPYYAHGVRATVVCAPPNVDFSEDPVVEFVEIPAGGGAWSKDTFTLKVDMTDPQDPNKGILWRVEFTILGSRYVKDYVTKFCDEPIVICP